MYIHQSDVTCIKMHHMIRLTIGVSPDTYEKLLEFSKKDQRSISATANLLLIQAIKEKIRKRNAAKENNS